MKQEEERRSGHWGWLYAGIAGMCVAAMRIGVGLLQTDAEYAIALGAAQGLLVCSLTVICSSLMEWLLTPVYREEDDDGGPVHPAR